MICKGDKVTIKISRDLLIMGLSPLIGKSGIITEVLTENKTPGAMVKLTERVMDYSIWFVPIRSIVTERAKTKNKKLQMLNETLL